MDEMAASLTRLPGRGSANDTYESPVEPVSPTIAMLNRPPTSAAAPADEGATVDTTTSLTCVSSVSDAELEKLQKAFEDAL